jgi:ABC-type uncharacterized transport system permease subunit
MPNDQAIQLGLLGLTAAFFAAAFGLGLRRLRRATPAHAAGAPAAGLPHAASIGPPARAAVAAGSVLGAALLAWRAAAEGTMALPLTNPFDAFLMLALLLAFLVAYFRWTRNLRSLSLFLLPLIVLLLAVGLLLAAAHPTADRPDYRNAWTVFHVVTIVAGTLCFALGCAGAAAYLLADRQLRRKGLDATHRWVGLPPLASIEKFNQRMIYLGFPLLTLATVAGILRLAQNPAEAGAGQGLKFTLGTMAWAVYAVLLHVPLNPRFRGPRAAWLFVIGFLLYVGAFAAARWN